MQGMGTAAAVSRARRRLPGSPAKAAQVSQSPPSSAPAQSLRENASAPAPFSSRNRCRPMRDATPGARVRYQWARASSSGTRARTRALLSREARDSSTLRLISRKGKGAPASVADHPFAPEHLGAFLRRHGFVIDAPVLPQAEPLEGDALEGFHESALGIPGHLPVGPLAHLRERSPPPRRA